MNCIGNEDTHSLRTILFILDYVLDIVHPYLGNFWLWCRVGLSWTWICETIECLKDRYLEQPMDSSFRSWLAESKVTHKIIDRHLTNTAISLQSSISLYERETNETLTRPIPIVAKFLVVSYDSHWLVVSSIMPLLKDVLCTINKSVKSKSHLLLPKGGMQELWLMEERETWFNGVSFLFSVTVLLSRTWNLAFEPSLQSSGTSSKLLIGTVSLGNAPNLVNTFSSG